MFTAFAVQNFTLNWLSTSTFELRIVIPVTCKKTVTGNANYQVCKTIRSAKAKQTTNRAH